MNATNSRERNLRFTQTLDRQRLQMYRLTRIEENNQINQLSLRQRTEKPPVLR